MSVVFQGPITRPEISVSLQPVVSLLIIQLHIIFYDSYHRTSALCQTDC